MRRRIPRLVCWLTVLALAPYSRASDFRRPLQPPRAFQVIAHRGAMQQAPGNTRSAIEFAIADGCEWVEVDVRLTKDGHHILFHDERLDGGTNGSGPVRESDLAAIRKLDAGSRFASRFAGERVLTLGECLELARGRVNLYLDCKDANPELLVQEVLEAGMPAQVVVFDDPDNLERVRKASQGKVAIMPKWHRELGLARWADDLRPDAVEVDADEVTRDVCRTFHDKGIRVQAKVLGKWDGPEFWDKVIAAGVDWLQTDLPEELIAHVVWKRMPKRPVRLAMHRGASRYAPENTLPAFAKAIRMGADLVEFDVHTTKDGAYYLLHDGNLDRTTTGHGPIREIEGNALAKLDAGVWFGRPFVGTKVPSLAGFLDAVKGKVDLYFDAKDIPPQAVADALARVGMVDRAVVYQAPDYLVRLKAVNPRIRALAPLSDPTQLRFLEKNLKPYAVDASWKVLSKGLIDRCHAAGIAVFSDAPDDKAVEDYMQAIRWGIDLIQTDEPLRLIRAAELLTAGPAASAPAGKP